MVTSSSLVAPLETIFRINDDLLSRALDDVRDDQLWNRPTDKNNPMLWVVGHIAQTRAILLGLIGQPFETGWGDLFARGSSIGDRDKYPAIEQIRRVLAEINENLYPALQSLDEERLAQPFPGVPGRTGADQIAGFAMHDSYHVGQLAYVRKGLGYSAVAG